MLRVPFSGRGFFDGRRRSAESRAFSPPALGDDSRKKHAFSENPVRPRFFTARTGGAGRFLRRKIHFLSKTERGAHGGALSSPFISSLRPFFDKPREASAQISAVFSNWVRALAFFDRLAQPKRPRRSTDFRGARRRFASAEAPPHRKPPKLFRHILPGTKNSLLQNQPSWRIMSVTSNCTAKG